MISVKEEYALKMNPVSTFKVAIYDMKVIDVINRDAIMIGNKKIMGSDAGDPYVTINFDDIHSAKSKFVSGRSTTEIAETYYMTEAVAKDYDSDGPVTDLANKDWYFMYETKYPKKLDRKYLTIVANDHDYVGKDDLIGEARVDLMTLAAGPVEHDLTLWDGDIEAGRVQFKVKMKQITCPVLRFDEFTMPNAPKEKFVLKVKFAGNDVKISNKKDRLSLEKEELTISPDDFPAVINMELKNVSFKTLYDKKLEILALPKGPAKAGKTQKAIAKAVISTKKILFSDAISVRSETLLGEDAQFAFTLRAYGLPFYAQMESGVDYGYEIKDGVQPYPEIMRIPIPHCSKKEVVDIEITESAMNPLENAPKEKEK